MTRIGILGGTFNPIHIGHLTIAEMARERMSLDKVIFIPSYLPPHKSGKDIASAIDRYRMLRLAVQGNPKFDVSDFEIKKEGKSYSVDTVRHLRKKNPRAAKFFFIIGSDLLPGLHTWKNIEELKKMVVFISVNRPGFRGKPTRIKVRSVSVPGLQTSSTFARRRLLTGKTVKYLVPDKVLDYIRKNKLYKKRH